MAADRFLDTEGLRHLWEKIKSFIHQNTHEYSVEELETPTAGYRNSYRLDKDGEAIEGSDIIDIPTELTPIVSKEYTGTDFYAPSSAWDNSSRYFMSVRPDALKEYWYVKYRVRVWIPSDTTEKRFTDSIIEYFGSGILMKGYRIWNTINTGSAAYYQVAYWLTDDGYNNQNPTDPFGHVLGTSIRSGTNYTTSSWYRHVKVDLLAYEGCEVNMFDNLVKWSEYKTSTGATNVATGVEHPDYSTTDPSTYNASSQGLQETGDATDTTNMSLNYSKIVSGTYGIMNRSLIMEDGDGKWQSFTATSGSGISKTKNDSGFRLGSHIYYASVTTDIAANTVVANSIIRTFVSLIDLRYSLNINTTAGGTANNLLPNKPLYIVGTLGGDGLFYLDDVWWTQDEPSSENSKIYIKVSEGIYNDYSNDRCYRTDLLYNGDAYWYKNGIFQRYYGVDWKADKVAYATEGDLAGLDSTGNPTDSGYSISDLENSINGQKVWFNCWTCEYGVHPYSLFSFAINPNKDGLCLTPFTTTGGTGNKQPVTTYWFPIGSNIYYHNSSEQAGQSGALKSGYTSFREVDVRYSAITGGNISLGSSINTSTYFYTTSVFLRVLISGEYWQPYHESGSTTEILVSIDQLVAGNYYIYLGKLSAETTDGFHYILQLEDNNPLYYFDGNDLIMYTKRGNIPSGGTTRQFLAKRSNSDYDVEWVGPAAAFITAYDYQNHRVTISDGTHSQEYQLTPYYPIPDYYIGWEYGTKREFASMSGSHLANNATPYMKADNTSYQSECLDTIFYVMFKPSSAPTSGSLLSGDGVNSNKLLSQITAAEFLAGGNCPHNDVTIGETTYKVYALMNVYLADGDNTITVNFN